MWVNGEVIQRKESEVEGYAGRIVSVAAERHWYKLLQIANFQLEEQYQHAIRYYDHSEYLKRKA